MNAGLPAPMGLPALERRLRQDLDWLEWPAKDWVPRREFNGQRVRDVVVIRAGMCGLAASAALKGLGLSNMTVLDRAPAGQEGPWATYARMETLRSPKQLTGPALGLPALTFRAWYEAQFGRTAWDALGKIPRGMWMDYLVWYRRVLSLPIANGTSLDAVTPQADDILALDISDAEGSRTIFTRHLVLATGRDGLGGPWVPPIAHGIDRKFWAHSADDIDFAALKGLRVGVIGAGASAMDNAATALEHGVASLDLIVRRKDLPRINKFTGIGSQGVVHGFAGLPDDWKWRFLDYALKAQTPPPRDSTLRVSRHANSRFHLGSPLLDLAERDGHLVLTTPKGVHHLDFLIFATGFSVDPGQRPELAAIAPFIRFWNDRYTPPPGNDSAELLHVPDLGPAFEFQEKAPGTCLALSHIHCFNYPAMLSHGKLSGDIPAVSDGAERLARGIARALFVADRETHYRALMAYDTPELLGDEWQDADAELEASHAGT
ncbi:NAD(P)-binding domain-containing protein [Bosea sp. BIWAKO-01]|uniref:NAD(P)-binding domain-containing protein n=1 Tax=Bosea sp. BIWAKO-01 TaxID=506668 RepID=UPI000853B7FE|nr:NAD(P)/FAD-dependent oxidoreductase [Bosea sp. BIWAKO-01]GAU84547.1 nucleoside-diphosphate-sugar epimerases [Bosea sp. BIWAKO-01]